MNNLTKIIFEDESNIQEICYRSFSRHLGVKKLILENFPKLFHKIEKDQQTKRTSNDFTDVTTVGFEIQINGEYSSSCIYKNLTHIPVYEADCAFSDLKWIIETDEGILEFVTPTFYVEKNNLKENIQLLYNYFNTIFNANINEYDGKNIREVINFLNKEFKINLQHKPLTKIETDCLKSNGEYLGDRKNIQTWAKTNWGNIKDEINSNSSDIPYSVHRNRHVDIFEVEAINIASTSKEIVALFNTENVYPYVNDTIQTAYTKWFETILPVADMTNPNDNTIFTFLRYEIYRLMFYYINSYLCSNKATQDYSNDDHSNLSVILTRLKTQSVWFKFDIVTFIKLGNLQLSESGKEQCTNIKTKITAIDENGFTQLFQTIVSNLLEEEYKQQLIDAVNKIKNEIYNTFKQRTEELLETLANTSTTERKLKCETNPPTCGECVSNFLDYNKHFYGIRHDTFIENALVVEYRNTSLLIT
jgi:hypothetical protein